MAAVNFATAPTVIPATANPHYQPYQQPRPQHETPESSSSPTSSSSYSPTSSRSHYYALPPHLGPQSRQLRPPKCPLYVPAVLRPTEPPSRSSPPKNVKFAGRVGASPLTPPGSAGASFDSGVIAEDEDVLRRALGDGLAKCGITRIVTDEWNERALEDVTGLPTREHWKPDDASRICDLPACGTAFTTFKRRHHCRRCGNIFCAPHSTHYVPLDQHARFHPEGTLGRACECCWADFKTWRRARHLRSMSSSGGSSSGASGTSTPTTFKKPADAADDNSVAPASPDTIQSPGDGTGRGSGEMVGSVPSNWNWSTF